MTKDNHKTRIRSSSLRLLLVKQTGSDTSPIFNTIKNKLNSVDIVTTSNFLDVLATPKQKYDIIIVDLLSIETDQEDLVSKISHHSPDTALIVLNGPKEQNFGSKIIAAGADNYFAKDSYDSNVLTFAILSSIEQRQVQLAQDSLAITDTVIQDVQKRGEINIAKLGPQNNNSAISSSYTKADLEQALDREEFVLYYQPIIDLKKGTVSSLEALIRWQHPTNGLVGPDLFIPFAESTNQIIELGAWVLEKACKQLQVWNSQGLDIEMAINLSPHQITSPGLIHTLTRILDDTQIKPTSLTLEVTESAIIEDAELAATVLNKITSLGISIAIDDFGTGYSSLVYLKRYHIRALKIDRSFTSGIGAATEDRAITASIIKLAKAVNGSSIAEGIETKEQYDILRSLSCTYGQGWFFSKAVPSEEIPNSISRCEANLLQFKSNKTPMVSRSKVADQRDNLADQRDKIADQRDKLADQRDKLADQRDKKLPDENNLSKEQRSHDNLERHIAQNIRGNNSDERTLAELERDTVKDDRHDAREKRCFQENKEQNTKDEN